MRAMNAVRLGAMVAGLVLGPLANTAFAKPGEGGGTVTRRYAGHGASSIGRGDNIGLGLRFGEPTGLTLKYWLDPMSAFTVAAWPRGGGVDAAGDYLYHFRNVTSGSVLELMAYLGGGLGVQYTRTTTQQGGGTTAGTGNGKKQPAPQPAPATTTSDSHTSVVVRGVLGGEVAFRRVPIGVFVELVPTVDLKVSNLALGGSIGARYYF